MNLMILASMYCVIFDERWHFKKLAAIRVWASDEIEMRYCVAVDPC